MNNPNKATSVFDKKDPHPERKVKPDPEQAELQKELDKALKDSFPASDPPAVTQPTKAGKPRRRKSAEV